MLQQKEKLPPWFGFIFSGRKCTQDFLNENKVESIFLSNIMFDLPKTADNMSARNFISAGGKQFSFQKRSSNTLKEKEYKKSSLKFNF